MEDNERFALHMEDHGSFLHIFIPGKIPGSPEMQTIRWTTMAPFPKSDDFKEEKRQFELSLKKKGLLKNLPKKIIPGYSHSYAYSVRFGVPYEICPNLDNLVYIRNDIAYVTNHMLWFPMMGLLEEKKNEFDHILIDVPVFPKIVTESFYQSWYDSNQKMIPYIHRIQNGSAQTRIHRQETESTIVLKIRNHMFEGQPTVRIRVDPRSTPCQTEPISKGAMADLRKRVFARDAYLLRGLNDKSRKCLARGQDIPLTQGYKLHWKTWLSLDGRQVRDNAILIPKDIDLAYRTSVQMPAELYLERNRVSLTRADKPVYVDIPVPVAHYRSKPIVRRCATKPQNRRELNRMAQQMVGDHIYDD